MTNTVTILDAGDRLSSPSPVTVGRKSSAEHSIDNSATSSVEGSESPSAILTLSDVEKSSFAEERDDESEPKTLLQQFGISVEVM
ncbi:unnamed protein product [Nippostrongylus brasiliensis]|uniref:Uncharacterized protein n=1 Tax=Nippostrongylus brasiliensis TaxID=27835 RepID=A0A0N4YP50_NIPBR|nr:unnamed protein product [Nippostrongylus brasiliensis]